MMKVLAIFGTVIMASAYGFTSGDFFREGSVLMALAWGKVSLVDVYVGFFLFSGWVVYREVKWQTALLWVLAIMVLGNFISCLYVTINLFRCNDTYREFWLGKHAPDNR